MKYIFSALMVSSMAFVTTAHSQTQTKNFEGLSAALNYASSSTQTDLSLGPLSVNFGDLSEGANLQFGYGIPLGDNGVFGFGGTYTLNDFYAGSVPSTSLRFVGKDMYSLYIEPGFKFNKSTLLYAKAAYLSVKGQLTEGGVDVGNQTINGLGYGAGLRMMFYKNQFLQFELTQSNYNSNTAYGISFKPSSLNRTVGIGFQF